LLTDSEANRMIEPERVGQLKASAHQYLNNSGEVSDSELWRHIEQEVLRMARSQAMTIAEMRSTVERVFHSIRGLDILQPLLENPQITEIMINGHQDIFIEENGTIRRYAESFESEERLEDIIQMIVGQVNRVV